MTGKLTGFLAVNLNPITSNFCQTMQKKTDYVCQYCYSQAMISSFRKRCGPVFSQNAEQMKEPLEDWQIPRFMPTDVVRFLAHGDMDTDMQFRNFCLIAKTNPETKFTMWTKRKDIVAVNLVHIPANLRMIQSSRMLGTIDAPAFGFDAVFTVYEDGVSIPEGMHLCHGKSCAECMYCYNTPHGFIAEVLKKGSKKLTA